MDALSILRSPCLAAILFAAPPFGAWAAPAGPYPTPEQAFAMLPPPDYHGETWEIPAHAEKLVPIKGGFALLVSGGAWRMCVACKPELSVAYFHKVRGQWRPAHVWKRVYQDGWNDQFGDVEMIDVGLPHPTVAVHGGYFNEGCSVDAIGFIELAPNGPILRAGYVPLDSENGGYAGLMTRGSRSAPGYTG